MNDWVNWQQYSDAVTPEAQRLADEREKLRTSQREQMLAATERFRGKSGELSSMPGYAEVMKQQQQGEEDWARSQARGLESLVGPQQAPQASGWEGLSRRLAGFQADVASRQKWEAQNRATADAQKAADEARRKQDAERKQEFYAGAYGKAQQQRMSQEDKRRAAQMLYGASASGDWRNDLSEWQRGALWESAYGQGSPFRVGFGTEEEAKWLRANRGPLAPAGPLGNQQLAETWRARGNEPARPKGWKGW